MAQAIQSQLLIDLPHGQDLLAMIRVNASFFCGGVIRVVFTCYASFEIQLLGRKGQVRGKIGYSMKLNIAYDRIAEFMTILSLISEYIVKYILIKSEYDCIFMYLSE